MTGEDNRTFVPTDWISGPAEGLFAGQTLASGNAAPADAVAKRIIVTGAGDLYLIPPKSTATAGVLFFASATVGMVFDQQCAGIGTSSVATVTAQFN